MNRTSLSNVVAAAVIATCAGAAPGCKGGDKPGAGIVEGEGARPAPAASGKKRVALVMKTLTNPFFVSMERGARRAEVEHGVELVVKTGAKETSIQQQIAIIDDLIADRVDAIVVAPGSSTELIPALERAQDAGIVVIAVDNRLEPALVAERGMAPVPFVSVDNERGAYLSAKYIADRITAPTEVAILEGIRSAQNAQERTRGAKRAFGDNPNVEVVAVETANWKVDEARDVTARLFEQHPDIGAMFCANDMMALGAIEYLDQAGKSGVLVGAYDGLAQAVAAIRDGKLLTTVDQRPDQQGYTGVVYAVRALQGETPPAETMIDVELITPENAGKK